MFGERLIDSQRNLIVRRGGEGGGGGGGGGGRGKGLEGGEGSWEKGVGREEGGGGGRGGLVGWGRGKGDRRMGGGR